MRHRLIPGMVGLMLLAALAAPSAQAASTVSGFPAASQPLGTLPDAVLLDQGTGCPTNVLPCTTSQSPSLRVGQPFQGVAAPATPFKYQQWWDTTNATTPQLKVYDGSTWNVSGTLNTSSHIWNASATPADVRTFGAMCDWNGTTGTDDTAAIQSALNWSVAIPGGSITGQTGAKCRITATLTVRKPYSALIIPVFPGTHHDAGSTAAVDTNFSLVWDGAAGGTMMDIEPASGAGALVGNAVKCVAFLCRGIAAYGLVLKSIRMADIDVFEHECTTAGVLTTTVSAAVVGENLDFFFGRVRVDGYQEANAGYIFQMT